MKIQGKQISGVNVVSIVLPRSDGDIILKAQGVTSYDEFDKLCPLPVAPMVKKPNGAQYRDAKDEKFQEALSEYSKTKSAWMIIKSLEATPGLEWEMVNMDDPSTWVNYVAEFEACGLTQIEMSRILEGVLEANGISQKAIDEAEKRFLAGQGQEQSGGSSPSTEKSSTPSGEPVKG